MADLTGYTTQEGVIIPDTSDLQQEVQQEYVSALGDDLDLSPETPQGRLIEAETLCRKAVLDNNALIANTLNPNTSFGVFLDALCAMTGTVRATATRTAVLCTLTGSPGTLVPAGSQARTKAGDMFSLVNDTTIPASGSVQSYFEAAETGAVACQVDTLTQIVTPVTGWETVNNPTAAVLGTEEESDSSLRAKRQQQLYRGEALLQAIISSVRQVEGVLSVYGYENYTNAIQTVDGISIQPHSIYIVVDGGEDADIAQAIFEHKSLGCGYTGTEEVTVTDALGTPYEVAFNRPDYQPVQINVTVTAPGTSVTADIQQSVKDALSAWANGEISGISGLGLGVDVSPFEAAAAISDYLPDLFVNNVQVGLVSGSLGTAVLEMKVNQKATVSQDNITVTVK